MEMGLQKDNVWVKYFDLIAIGVNGSQPFTVYSVFYFILTLLDSTWFE